MTVDVYLGLGWDPKRAEEILEDPPGDYAVTLPIVLLGVEAADEADAKAYWADRYPELNVDVVITMEQLLEAGASSP